MADQQQVPWVCPWGICNHDQAQACRADMKPSRGCGGRFPPGMTPEYAKQEVAPRGVPARSGITEGDVTAALQVAHLRDTPESRKDMRRALERVFTAGVDLPDGEQR